MKCIFLTFATFWSLTPAATFHISGTNRPNAIDNHYIVQYHQHANSETRIAHEAFVHAAATTNTIHQGIIKTFCIGAFNAYHLEANPSTLAQLNNTGIIHSVHQDAVVSISSVLPVSAHTLREYSNDISSSNSTVRIKTISTATWGQARVSHRKMVFGTYIIEEAQFPTPATVYVIDTGIQASHQEFNNTRSDPSKPASRVRFGANFVTNPTTDADENGHGTHVAGTIGGLTYGIAPAVDLVAVKVFDANGKGTFSGMIAGVEYAVSDAQENNATGTSLINMSSGGGFFQPLNDAVSAGWDAGVLTIVAAGNNGGLASDLSPASCADAVTVSASDWIDERPGFANYGPAVDVFAPGLLIESAWIGEGDGETMTLSGTSQAAPHVTGLMAYWVRLYGGQSPVSMMERLRGFATVGAMNTTGLGEGSPDMLVFNGNSQEVDG